MFVLHCTLHSYIKLIITHRRQVILKIWRITEAHSILHDIWYVTEHANRCSPVTADEKSETPCINVIIILLQISKPTMCKCMNKVGQLYIYEHTHIHSPTYCAK
jgi:hypothetical protein